jgi:hypothetical protein
MVLRRRSLRSEVWQEKKRGCDPWDQLLVERWEGLPILGLIVFQ